jgi:hypothetical protein
MVSEYGPELIFIIGVAVVIAGVVWQIVRWLH